MTKLMEWLAGFSILIAIWLSFVTNTIENEFTKQHPTIILISPVIILGLFGLYAAIAVFYRVFTFNDCEEAANELQELIQIAKEDLEQRGYEFSEQRG